MLRVFVVSQNGSPPASPLSAVFGEGIGSIGRDEANTLALPDPYKHISRVQAQVKCLSGEYFLVDQGGNPTSVNGRPLGKGNVASLHDGDRIEMAEWILRVETVRPASGFSAGPASATSDSLGLLNAAAPQVAHPDALAALLMGSDAAVAIPTERNDSSLLNDAFVRPQTIAPEDEFDFNLPTQIVVGTPDNPGAGKAPIAAWGQASSPAEMQPAPIAAPALAVRPTPVAKTAAPQAAAKVSVPAPPAPLPAALSVGSGNSAELLAAFQRGLGVPGLNPPGGLTPELAEHIGVMLRESVQGTVDLLESRAAIKREVHAEMPMIVSKNKNPLKISADVNFALRQLLQPAASKDLLPPVEAMRDVYDDLRADQIGFIAGMRGALAGILGRFRPAELEARLSDKSVLDHVLPADRKAKLWDSYEQRYADVLREAEDEFHSLFGREFLRAYEKQIDRLSNDRTSR